MTGSSVLTTLVIEVTQRCPNRCLFCSSDSGRGAARQDRVSLSTAYRLAKEAARLGLAEVSLSGGEPLLRRDLEPMVRGFYENRIRSKIYTSGQCRSHLGTVEAWTDWLPLAPFRPTLVFNLQSHVEKIHDVLVGRAGAHARTLLSLTSALEGGFDTEVHVVPSLLNFHSLHDSALWLLSRGVGSVKFLRLVMQGAAQIHSEKLMLGSAENAELKVVMRHLKAEFGDRVAFPGFYCPRAGNTCHAGVGKLLVRWDGQLLPCAAFKSHGSGDSFVLADAESGGSLAEALAKAQSHHLLACARSIALDSQESCPAQALTNRGQVAET